MVEKKSVKKLVVVALVIDAFVEKRLVDVEFVMFELVPKILVIVPVAAVIVSKIGFEVNVYVTFPFVSVATVRFEFDAFAKKFKRFDTEVVAITPFTVDVIIPELAEIVFELIMFVEEDTPFTTDVSVFTVDERSFEFMKFAVVVEIIPFVFEVSVKELVLVATVKVLFVIIEEVAIELLPSIDVRVFPVAEREFEVFRFVVVKFVVVPEFDVKLFRVAVLVEVKLDVVRFVPVALSNIKLEM
jgi:hypothetical protein